MLELSQLLLTLAGMVAMAINKTNGPTPAPHITATIMPAQAIPTQTHALPTHLPPTHALPTQPLTRIARGRLFMEVMEVNAPSPQVMEVNAPLGLTGPRALLQFTAPIGLPRPLLAMAMERGRLES